MSETFGISTDHNKDISRVVVRPCTGPWMMEGWNAERSSQVVVPWWWYKFRMYSCKIYITQINAHKRRWPNEEGADRSRLASSRGNTNLSRADRSVGEGEFSRPPPGGKKRGKMPRESGKHAKHAQIAKIRVSICTRIPPICVGCCTYLVSFGLLCLLWILVGGLEVVLALGVIIIILLHCSSHCFLLSSSSSSLSLSSWLALLLSEK